MTDTTSAVADSAPAILVVTTGGPTVTDSDPAASPPQPVISLPRSSNWSADETEALIAVWGEEDVRWATDDPFTRKKTVYVEIARHMASLGFSRTAVQVKNKIKQLKQKHKMIAESGRGRRSWIHFESLDRVLARRPTVNPSPPADVLDTITSGPSSSREHASHSDQDELDESGWQDSDVDTESDEEDGITTDHKPVVLAGLSNTDDETASLGEDNSLGDESFQDEVHPPVEQVAPEAKKGKKGKPKPGAAKSVAAMLKLFMEKQDLQDERFMQRAEREAKLERQRAEREAKLRQEELELFREQLREERLARANREAREQKRDEMLQSLLLQMSRSGATSYQEYRHPMGFDPCYSQPAFQPYRHGARQPNPPSDHHHADPLPSSSQRSPVTVPPPSQSPPPGQPRQPDPHDNETRVKQEPQES